jgi:hypothetical protein
MNASQSAEGELAVAGAKKRKVKGGKKWRRRLIS